MQNCGMQLLASLRPRHLIFIANTLAKILDAANDYFAH